MSESSFKNVVLEWLADGPMPGKSVRRAILEKLHTSMSAAYFYVQMAHLEDSCDVVGFWKEKMVAGQLLKERCYRLPKPTAPPPRP